MIYLANIPDTQRLCIPASPARRGDQFSLLLRNTVDGQEYVLGTDDPLFLIDATGAFVVDASGLYITLSGGGGDGAMTVDAVSGGYYFVSVTLPSGMAEGEYEYVAELDGETVACGLAHVGDFRGESIDYRNTVIYEQYEQ